MLLHEKLGQQRLIACGICKCSNYLVVHCNFHVHLHAASISDTTGIIPDLVLPLAFTRSYAIVQRYENYINCREATFAVITADVRIIHSLILTGSLSSIANDGTCMCTFQSFQVFVLYSRHKCT